MATCRGGIISKYCNHACTPAGTTTNYSNCLETTMVVILSDFDAKNEHDTNTTRRDLVDCIKHKSSISNNDDM